MAETAVKHHHLLLTWLAAGCRLWSICTVKAGAADQAALRNRRHGEGQQLISPTGSGSPYPDRTDGILSFLPQAKGSIFDSAGFDGGHRKSLKPFVMFEVLAPNRRLAQDGQMRRSGVCLTLDFPCVCVWFFGVTRRSSRNLLVFPQRCF